MRILITGGSGFLGRRVVARAVAAGHDVRALARGDQAARTLRELGATDLRGDLDDPAGLAAAFLAADATALVNLASLGFGHIGAILDATSAGHLHRAVFVSTTGIRTRLEPPTKRVRLAAERAIEASGLDWTIIRPTMIYGGADDRNMARLLTLLAHLPTPPQPGRSGGRSWRVGLPPVPVPVPGAAHLHQPVHVDDLAATVLRAVTAQRSVGRAYDVAGPWPLPLRDIVTAAGSALGRRVHPLSVPLGPALLLAQRYERHAARPRLKAEQIARLAEDKAYDIGPARRDLGHQPRPFEAGIADQAAAMGLTTPHPAPSPAAGSASALTTVTAAALPPPRQEARPGEGHRSTPGRSGASS
ncbi:NAD(P)H-binding protein [Frankia sp. AgPm24]|uniref:NAD-dependent epimerase/dehydratase family protein n=1 Tax=Frankia sp. AgPm24 TaxID=631128 RepID=UPI0020107456|nr:NAD(P)H-binding protein [Frankia sp. AgPm24]MCK9921739.1 NAD(P)H-binding protein [Frankia sp. AgPm24]